MAVELELAQDRITAYLSGEIDHHIAAQLRQDIDQPVMAAPPALLVLDFGGVTFMDSSGIGLIMGRYKLMQESGGRLLVQNVPPALRKVMKVSGLDKLGVMEKMEDSGR